MELAFWSGLCTNSPGALGLAMVFISPGVRAQVGNPGIPRLPKALPLSPCCGLDKSAPGVLPEVPLGPQIPRFHLQTLIHSQH